MRSHTLDTQEAAERDKFITSTYNYFYVSLISMICFGFIGFRLLPEAFHLPIFIADCILWILCGWFGWRNPITFVFPTFIVVTGLTLGITAFYFAENNRTEIFAYAAALTMSVFFILTLYVHISKRNFDGLIGFLIAGFWIILAGFLIHAFTQITYLNIGLAILGTLLFCAWILYDTSRIVRYADPYLTPAVAAFELFLDIIGLFSYVLELFGISKD